jgi:biopolymer transport protein ExbD
MRLRTYALLTAAILSVVFVSISSIHASRPSAGFNVLLLKIGPPSRMTDYWGNNLVVQVDSQKRWSLNADRNMPREQFSSELKESLCRRAERLVVFHADAQLNYGDAIESMDAIRSVCDTQIALITVSPESLDWSSLYLPDQQLPDRKSLPTEIVPEALR